MKDRLLIDLWNQLKSTSFRKKALAASLVVMLLLLFIPIITYAYFSRDIADRERLMNRNNTGIVLLDRHGEVIYSYGRVNPQNDVKLSDINDTLEQAVIASEDEEFYEHGGYSFRGIASAIYANFLSKDPSLYGGSTITQQLVKNTLLTANKNFLRKYQEVSMAIAVERHYTKDEILEMYLNSVYFGEGAFGIEQAAEMYFDKSPQELSLAESSMLIGLLPAPSAYSPVSGDKQKAEDHQARVLRRMEEAGYITSSQRQTAENQELAYEPAQAIEQKHAHHFAMMTLEELAKKYGEETIARGGYKVTTTLDLEWQKQAEQNVANRVRELSHLKANNAGLVAIDPKNGEIRALVGGVDWDNAEFGKVNVTTSPRQPGSSFKPIYYAEALDKQAITAATMLKDEPTDFGNYKPQNYDFKFRGDITVRRALALSLNIPAVKVMQKVGYHEASTVAQRMGISTVTEPDKYGLSLALGTAETKLLEMTNAYAAFANSGNQFVPTTILSIKDKFDDNVRVERQRSKQVASPAASFLVSSILSDYDARQPTFGSNLTISGRSAAAKTGTTDQNRDAWTIGYTPNLAVGVWLGNSSGQPMSGIAGASGAAPIWRRSITTFLQNMPVENFKQPFNVIRIDVCKSSGKRAEKASSDTYGEYFIKGTEPSERCNTKKEGPKEEKKPPDEKKEDHEKKDDEEEEEDEEGGRGGDPGEGDGEEDNPPPPPPDDEEPLPPPPPEED